eukprot:TRINITY_DN13141_c0_g1_i5.p1 TRINITY_DN13141_c0_g1~~TRINITY_DN13141_c0_g1_i5.p1  ORF type:complete len:745 (-),score=80.51 TRINITY_DN13141_c0_g1_i5:57-2264(-)
MVRPIPHDKELLHQQSGRCSDFCGDFEDETVPQLRRQRFVMYKDNGFRRFLTAIVSILLVWTATVFPYLLCFVHVGQAKASKAIISLESLIDVVFWIDLFSHFFFTYDDKLGREIDSPKMIMKEYLCTHFSLNLLACLPSELFGAIAKLMFEWSSDSPGGPQKITRLARLQRVSRCTRIFRLGRLAHITQSLGSSEISKNVRRMQRLRVVRIINNAVFLFWITHLLACGWYACAALHDVQETTWIYRRTDAIGAPLAESSSLQIWWHSVYFILTVFTSVGFGDMFPITDGEIAYVSLTMCIGAVVNGIIVSEIMNIVGSFDRNAAAMQKKRQLLESFAEHTDLNEASKRQLLETSYNVRNAKPVYDVNEMWKLFMGTTLPDELMFELPNKVFQERLLINQFICICATRNQRVPPQFPLLVACSVTQRIFLDQEIVYHIDDQPCDVFLVLSGIFAHVALATGSGGVESEHLVEKMRSVPTKETFSRSWTQAFSPSLHSSTRRGAVVSANRIDDASRGLSPYQLFGPKSYFGDAELLLPSNRRTSVRSEKDSGTVLALNKTEFAKLCEEYPTFRRTWTCSAQRREQHRLDLLCRHKRRMTCYSFAAMVIQRFFRFRRRRRFEKLRSSSRCDTYSDLTLGTVVSDNNGRDPEASDAQRLGTSETSPSATEARSSVCRSCDKAIVMLSHMRTEMDAIQLALREGFDDLRRERAQDREMMVANFRGASVQLPIGYATHID